VAAVAGAFFSYIRRALGFPAGIGVAFAGVVVGARVGADGGAHRIGAHRIGRDIS